MATELKHPIPTMTKYDEDNYRLKLGRRDMVRLIKLLRLSAKDPEDGLGGKEFMDKITEDFPGLVKLAKDHTRINSGTHVHEWSGPGDAALEEIADDDQ